MQHVVAIGGWRGLAWVYPGGMRYRAPYSANDNCNSGNDSNTGERSKK